MKNLITLVFGMIATLFVAQGISTVAFDGQYLVETTAALTVGSLFIVIPSGSLAFALPLTESQGLFTKGLIAVYKEIPATTSFLRSFFPSVESMTKEVSIAVRRGSEFVAVDVAVYSDGNRNTFDKSTEKIMVPPLYHEYLTANEHRLYDQVITAIANGNVTYFKEITAELALDLMELRKKIERAVELQCAQVLETGVVQLANNTDINFQRKAASLIAYTAGNDFNIGTVSPYNVLKTGANFIRTKGKSNGSVYNVIMGDLALDAFLNNTIVQARADVRNFQLDQIREPQKNSTGGVLHGRVSAGAYSFNIWSYPEFYDNATSLNNSYIDPKKIIILPENPNFKTAYGAVPQLISQAGTIPQSGAYLMQQFIDEKKGAHEEHIKSAPIAVPVAVDQIWTAQVVAP